MGTFQKTRNEWKGRHRANSSKNITIKLDTAWFGSIVIAVLVFRIGLVVVCRIVVVVNVLSRSPGLIFNYIIPTLIKS